MMRDSASPKKSENVDKILDNDHDSDLAVLCYMNKGFVNIFDGNYKDAIENFRKILAYKP